VPGDAIVLADLLPPSDIPASVRALADGIALGRTPQSGAWRYLSGAAVADAIERAGTASEDFVIPQTIAVQRLDRALSGEEILASVRAAVARFALSPDEESAVLALRDGDVYWDSALRVPVGGAGLQVQDISVDLVAGRADVRMTAETPAHRTPFVVVAHVPRGQFSAPQDGVERATVPALRAAAPADPGEAAASPVLVATGQMAHLRLHSANSSIQLEVLALQPGHARETIRVRLPLTGRTLRAAVTGRETLDASF